MKKLALLFWVLCQCNTSIDRDTINTPGDIIPGKELSIKGQIDVGGNCIVWENNYIYTAGDSFLYVVDARNPESLRKVATFRLFSSVRELRGAKPYLYLLGPSCLSICDITSPEAPEYKEKIDISQGRDITVIDSFAYLLTKSGKFIVIKVDNFTPKIIASCDLKIEDGELCIRGNYAYIVTSLKFIVIDISIPSNPKIETYSVDWDFGPQDIVVKENYLYVLYQISHSIQYMAIFDITQPSSPKKISSIKTRADASYTITKIYVHNKYAYLFGEMFQVIDISSPVAPYEFGYGGYDEGGKDITLGKEYIYTISHYGDVGWFKLL